MIKFLEGGNKSLADPSILICLYLTSLNHDISLVKFMFFDCFSVCFSLVMQGLVHLRVASLDSFSIWLQLLVL